MINPSPIKKTSISFLCLAALGLSACGGSTEIENSGQTTPITSSLSFNISSATALQAMTDVVAEVNSRSANGLFTYQIIGATDSRNTVKKGTNLLAVDDKGNASLALSADLPIKVMYSAVSPVSGKLYLALDNSWYVHDSNVDLQSFIAAANCAFYEVTPSDNTYKCVSEGKFLQDYNDNYYKTISGNQKPIQFDEEGNVYFLATSFNVTGDACCRHISTALWNPRLYKYTAQASSPETTAITQDNESINFFMALAGGDIVYQSNNIDGNHSASLKMYRATGNVIDLSDDNWGVSFFAADTSDTVLFGDWDSNAGIRLASPGLGVGIVKTTLDTTAFGDGDVNNNNSWLSASPRRVLVADDGHVYGVFEGTESTQNSSGNWIYTKTLSLYQMLPYDAVPKIKLTIDNNDWWGWMDDTPFQISKGYLYYKETVANVIFNGESLGSTDYINIINLATREKTSLLNPVGDPMQIYEMYSWQLSGDKLYFSALDKTRNVVVSGKIDTQAVKKGDSVNSYLSIQDSASALGATSSIKDIAVLKPVAPERDTGSAPTTVADGIHLSVDNAHSASVEFSKYMDKASVESGLSIVSSGTLTEGDSDGKIPYMPVWVYKTLHLVPDLSTSGLADVVSAGFSPGQTYTLTYGQNIKDKYEWSFAPSVSTLASSSITMAPSSGWYINDTSAKDSTISSSKVGRFAGTLAAFGKSYKPEAYKIGDLVNTPNFRIEFSAKNLGRRLGGIMLWDPNQSSYNDKRRLRVTLSSDLGSSEHVTNNSHSIDVDYSHLEKLSSIVANGQWQIYRLDVYDNSFRLGVKSNSAQEFEYVLSKHNLGTRSASAYELIYLARDQVAVDNIKISTLDTNGKLANTEADIVNQNFDTEGLNISTVVTPMNDVDSINPW